MLGDLLGPGLRVVIYGTAVGKRSAQKLEYYAGRGNCFWRVLKESNLTPSVTLSPCEFRRLAEFGIGLTDLAKNVARNDREIPLESFDRQSLLAKMLDYQPRVLAFNGKKASSIFLTRPTRSIEYGSSKGASWRDGTLGSALDLCGGTKSLVRRSLDGPGQRGRR